MKRSVMAPTNQYMANGVNPSRNSAQSEHQSLNSLHRVWIGAYRFDGNDNWTYTTGKPVTYTDWYSGQPDESGDACVSLIGPFTSNYFFNWADYPCDEGYAFSFVCQEN